jgi:amino acid transporter
VEHRTTRDLVFKYVLVYQRIGEANYPKYWKNPGLFVVAGLEPRYPALDNFLGILSVIAQAAFAYQGIEIVAVYVVSHSGLIFIHQQSDSAASETENPRRNIAKAIRRVFYRILVFYVEHHDILL